MKYRVLIERSAQKELSKIHQEDQSRLITSIQGLSDNPRPSGAKKLAGRNAWRIRVGNYRVIYEIQDKELVVLVIMIGHRKKVYRR